MPLIVLDCNSASILPTLDAFFSAFNRALSVFRVAFPEAKSTSLTPFLVDTISAPARPFSCSLASFFNRLPFFRASFERLSSILSPLVAVFFNVSVSLLIRETSCIPWPVSGALANFFNLFASLRSSFESSFPRSSPLPTAILEPSSLLLFFGFCEWSCLLASTALPDPSVIARLIAFLWSLRKY